MKRKAPRWGRYEVAGISAAAKFRSSDMTRRTLRPKKMREGRVPELTAGEKTPTMQSDVSTKAGTMRAAT